ncbi:RNA polymerase sigma-70 factor [Parabacteroides sp. 52]|uniref:RNA polymerase sigma-70 factor n=1 Tax=unclassified Parabacteroides TaxID=2649774 RepID=UPI0013CFDE01|nr:MULTISPECIES: RNA polymerase sigma-70 factor [unclassified Parabacteroides]MDH6533572.1 RNA polymerase sigma-70 factor (ECF subfamily) [Parabacteroides sp. PM5-20]NDV54324.1 RNA polymerase sigma-70 factor [Parabacteroides sp. 52]
MRNDFFVLKKIKEGDIKAFENIFRLYYSPLCMYATSLTGQMDTAEEIVQELFYVFWKERANIQLFHSLKSYLYGAVRNRSFQYLEHLEVRNRYREAILSQKPTGSISPLEQLEYEELQQLIKRTIHRLPKRRQRIFQMHRLEGMKYAEIASALSVSVKTVEAEMSKALQTLRKEIENYTHIA